VVAAKTFADDETECRGDYGVVGRDLGGGSGTLNIAINGCSTSGAGTAPMGKRAIVGRLGVGQEVSVHAPSQPAITAQALKAMPMGPNRAQMSNTTPVIQRRRIKLIVSLPLERDMKEPNAIIL
jgi:hypothetical protein